MIKTKKGKLLILTAAVSANLIRDENYLLGKIDVLGERLSFVRKFLELIIFNYFHSIKQSNNYYRYLDYDDVLTDGEDQLIKIYILENFFSTELFGELKMVQEDFINDFNIFINSVLVTHDRIIDSNEGDFKNYSEENHDHSAIQSSALSVSKITKKLKTDCIIYTDDKDHKVIRYVPDARIVTEERYSFEGTVVGIVDDLSNSKARAIVICNDSSIKQDMYYSFGFRKQLIDLWDTQEVATLYVKGDAPNSNPTARDCTTLNIISIKLLQKKLI